MSADTGMWVAICFLTIAVAMMIAVIALGGKR